MKFYTHSHVRWLAPSLPFVITLPLVGVFFYLLAQGMPTSSAIAGGLFLVGFPLVVGLTCLWDLWPLAFHPVTLTSLSITFPVGTRRQREVPLSDVVAVCLVLTRGPIAFQAWRPFLYLTGGGIVEVYPLASERYATIWGARKLAMWAHSKSDALGETYEGRIALHIKSAAQDVESSHYREEGISLDEILKLRSAAMPIALWTPERGFEPVMAGRYARFTFKGG